MLLSDMSAKRGERSTPCPQKGNEKVSLFWRKSYAEIICFPSSSPTYSPPSPRFLYHFMFLLINRMKSIGMRKKKVVKTPTFSRCPKNRGGAGGGGSGDFWTCPQKEVFCRPSLSGELNDFWVHTTVHFRF